MFTKLSREVIGAARSGGADPAANFRLRQAIDKASGVPDDNIKRAVAKGAGLDSGDQLEDLCDVQRVSSNFELPDALMAELSSMV